MRIMSWTHFWTVSKLILYILLKCSMTVRAAVIDASVCCCLIRILTFHSSCITEDEAPRLSNSSKPQQYNVNPFSSNDSSDGVDEGEEITISYGDYSSAADDKVMRSAHHTAGGECAFH